MTTSATQPRGAAFTVLVALSLSSAAALAQPNPFDDYERGEIAPEAKRELPPPSTEQAPVDAEPDAAGDHVAYVMRQHNWTLGAGVQFAYTGTTNELLSGENESNRTLFLTLAPRFGYFVIDQLETTLSLGLLSKLTSRERGSSVAENNFFFELAGHYHIPVGSSGFALIPGVGMGGYFGGSSRTFTAADGSEFDESTSTAGFLINGYIGVAYMPSPNWRLRSGLALGALFGSESVSSQDQSLAANAAHIGLPFEVVYVF